MPYADPPPFFHRGPSPLARLAFFAVLSIVLLVADSRFRYLEGIRHAVNVVIAPLERAVLWPAEAWQATAAYFASKNSLAADNAALREHLLAEAPTVQGATRLAAENARLQALLGIRERYAANAIAAGVLFGGRDPFSQKLFIDKGSDAGIEAGAAVIDEAGVVGQLTRVYASMAEVTLLTDKDQTVPVANERTGVRSVLYGAGAGRPLELRFMPPTADVVAGDRLVTSGLDGTYPPGLAVARVEAIERDTGQIFARIACEPLAGVDRASELLVVGRATALPARPDEPAAPSAARKPGRAKARRGG